MPDEYYDDKFKDYKSTENHKSETPCHKVMRELFMAEVVAMYSKDPSTQVGAVLTPPDISRRYTGYNGFPPWMDDDPQKLNSDNKKFKYANIVHAERNALSRARKAGETTEGWYLFINKLPCLKCVERIIFAKIGTVVFLNEPMSKTWENDKTAVFQELKVKNIKIIIIELEDYIAWKKCNPISSLTNGKYRKNDALP